MKRIKKTFEGILDQGCIEDSNTSWIFDLSETEDNPNDTMFVKVQSHDETREHNQIKQFIDKKVRITIEVIE